MPKAINIKDYEPLYLERILAATYASNVFETDGLPNDKEKFETALYVAFINGCGLARHFSVEEAEEIGRKYCVQIKPTVVR